ncbi:MAG: metal-dependent hydrolase [Glaciihabitans sp.]|nr:metal-dependent hydrolase [Glaciihabitans sp.]
MTGAAAWLAVTATAGHGLGLFPVEPVGVLVGALVCAGAALMPDADHGSATIAHSVPIVGKIITHGISHASGGHRHGFHALLAVVCAWLLSSAVSGLVWEPLWWNQPVGIGAAAISAVSIAVALKALGLARGEWTRAWQLAIVPAMFVAFFAPDRHDWFPVCFTLGYAVHLLGDLLTRGGLPLLWPLVPKPPKWWLRIALLRGVWLRGGNIALPILGRTGSYREWIVLVPVSIYVVYATAFAALQVFGVNLAGLISTVGG